VASYSFSSEASREKGSGKVKVGVVTFFGVPNYGAMLQAYAMWKYLEKHGHQVEFVDYSVCKIKSPSLLRCFLTRHLRAMRIRLRTFVRYHIVDFASRYPCTRRYTSYEDLIANCPKYDCLIVGSDQMWNPMWFSDEKLPFVMLDFARMSCPRLALSVSFGTNRWCHNQNAELAGELMRRFRAISVRESSGVELVTRLSGRNDVECLADPTLLWDSKFYLALALNAKNYTGKFMFEYFLDEWPGDNGGRIIVEHIMHILDIKSLKSDHVPVCGLLAPICRMLGISSKVKVGSWLSCLSNAAFVCTNSFHGTVFSLIFHRPFVTVLLKGEMSGMNERVLSLLSKVGLLNRAIYSNEIAKVDVIAKELIDWHHVDECLEFERMRYNDFIEKVGL